MIKHVTGDPLLTQQPMLAVGVNAAARIESTPLYATLYDRYPAAFAALRKRRKTLKTGMIVPWRESAPALLLLVVRETPVGAARLRYVETCMMTLARDHQLLGLRALAIAPLGAPHERDEIALAAERWLGRLPLPVILYDDYSACVQADESLMVG